MRKLIVVTTLLFIILCLRAENTKYFSYGQPKSEIAAEGDSLWFGSDFGLTSFNPVTGGVTYYAYNWNNLYSGSHFVVDTYGNKWFTKTIDYDLYGNLVKFDGTEFVDIGPANSPLQSDNVLDLAADGSGNVWVATTNQGIIKYSNQEQNWSVYNSQNSGLPTNEIISVFVDNVNQLWAGTSQHGLINYSEGTWTTYTNPEWLMQSFIHHFAQSADSTLWFSSVNSLCSFKNGIFNNYDTFQYLTNVTCMDSVVLVEGDKSGLVMFDPQTGVFEETLYSTTVMSTNSLGTFATTWLGFYRINEGWNLLHPGNFYYPSVFTDICYDTQQNKIWVKYDTGIAAFSGSWTYYNSQNANIDFTKISGMTVDSDGKLWFAYYNENYNDVLLSYDGENWVIYPEVFLPNQTYINFNNLVCDRQNRVWACVNGSIAYYQNNAWIPILEGEINPTSRLVFDELNQLWFGDFPNQLCRYNGTWTYWQSGNPSVIGYVTAVCALTASDIWFADQEKLYHFTGDVIEGIALPPYLYTVKSITKDNQNNLWLDTESALVYYDGMSFTTYTYSRNANSGQHNLNMIIDNNQNKWTTLREQIYVFNQNGIVGNTDEEITKPEYEMFNYPNPFNPETTISFNVAKPGPVELSIYNIKGQRVKTLINKTLETGKHQISWKGVNESNKSVSSGVYFYKLKLNGKEQIRKMLLMK